MLRDVLYALALGFAIGALTVPATTRARVAVTTRPTPWPRLLPKP